MRVLKLICIHSPKNFHVAIPVIFTPPISAPIPPNCIAPPTLFTLVIIVWLPLVPYILAVIVKDIKIDEFDTKEKGEVICNFKGEKIIAKYRKINNHYLVYVCK